MLFRSHAASGAPHSRGASANGHAGDGAAAAGPSGAERTGTERTGTERTGTERTGTERTGAESGGNGSVAAVAADHGAADYVRAGRGRNRAANGAGQPGLSETGQAAAILRAAGWRVACADAATPLQVAWQQLGVPAAAKPPPTSPSPFTPETGARPGAAV